MTVPLAILPEVDFFLLQKDLLCICPCILEHWCKPIQYQTQIDFLLILFLIFKQFENHIHLYINSHTFSPRLSRILLVKVLNLGWPWKVAAFGQKRDRVKLVLGSGKASGYVNPINKQALLLSYISKHFLFWARATHFKYGLI